MGVNVIRLKDEKDKSYDKAEILTKAVFDLKIENMQKDAMLKGLGSELAKNKIEIMQMKAKLPK